MVFKNRFFSSSKKSDSSTSSPDGSNSPRTPSFGSPSRSEKKKVRSDPAAPLSSGVRSASCRQILVKDAVQKRKDKDAKGKDAAAAVAAAATPAPSIKPSPSSKLRKGTEIKDGGGSLSPILASSLGLNRIRTRSGPLPQEGTRGEPRISGLGTSNLGRGPVDPPCSTSSSGKASVKKKDVRGVPKSMELQGVSWADRAGIQGVEWSADAQTASKLSNGEPSAMKSLQSGKVNLSWNHSEDLRSSAACTSKAEQSPYDYCETPKESESPRFKAIMQATSAPRKRNPGDIKSFSHELNSKGVRPYPFWKPKGMYNLKEVVKVIHVKFAKAKDEVNSDLAVFAGDLIGVMEKNAESHPEWNETLEDLLLLARNCAVMPSEEFWFQCEGIVQELDDRRQELPMGVLKKLHTRMLFILTRCTRLLQFHKESGFADDEPLMDFQDPRLMSSADKKDAFMSGGDRKNNYVAKSSTEAAASRKFYSQEQHNLKWKRSQEIRPFIFVSPPDVDNVKEIDSPTSRERMSSWKPLPSPAVKTQKESSPIKEDTLHMKESASKLLIRGDSSDTVLRTVNPPELCSSGNSSVNSFARPKHKHKISWGNWVDQQYIPEDGSIMCRICEEYVPTSFVEDHSKICAVADRCDLPGLTVDERLIRIAETLEKSVESFLQKDNVVGSPDIAKVSNTSVTEEPDVLSPKISDWSRRGSADMFDSFQETDNSLSRSFLVFSGIIADKRFIRGNEVLQYKQGSFLT